MGKRTSDYNSTSPRKRAQVNALTLPKSIPKDVSNSASTAKKPKLMVLPGGAASGSGATSNGAATSSTKSGEMDVLSLLADSVKRDNNHSNNRGKGPRDLLNTLRRLVDEAGPDGLETADLPDLAARWLRDRKYMRGLSEGTLRGYGAAVERLIWFLESRNCEFCGEEELEGFIAYCRDGQDEGGGRWGHSCESRRARAAQMGPRSVRIHYNNIRAFFGWMVKKGHLARSPFERMEPPKEPQKEVEPFREDHIVKLLEAARHSLQPRRDVALLLVLLDCALRAEEFCCLCHKDLNLEERTLKVRKGKGNKERTVVFSPLTAAALWNYLEDLRPHPEDALFQSQRGTNKGGALSPRGLHRVFTRLGTAAGIDDVRCSPHTMRHAAASMYLMRGGSIEDLRRVLGHSTTRMSAHYVHLNQEHMREQHRRFSPVEGLLRKR